MGDATKVERTLCSPPPYYCATDTDFTFPHHLARDSLNGAGKLIFGNCVSAWPVFASAVTSMLVMQASYCGDRSADNSAGERGFRRRKAAYLRCKSARSFVFQDLHEE